MQMFQIVRKGEKNKTENIIIPVSNAMVCSDLEYCVLFWCLHLEDVTLDPENVQRKSMMIKCMGWNGFHRKK